MLPLTLHLTTAFTKHLLLTMGLPDSSVGRESTCNVGDPGLIPGLGRSTGEGKVYPLQYSCLENSMGCIGHKESDTTERLSLHFTYYAPQFLLPTTSCPSFNNDLQGMGCHSLLQGIFPT